MEEFEPTIIAFVCNWCTYTAADLAGTSRLGYPKNIRLIRVMCTGMVDPQYVIKAFLEGADAVLISGCHPGDCHYINGNWRTAGRFPMMEILLEQLNIDPRRLRLEWVSAAEGDKWAHVVTEFVEQIRELGPLNWQGQFHNEYEEEQQEAVTT